MIHALKDFIKTDCLHNIEKLNLIEKRNKEFDELELLFNKAKPHLSEDDKETMKFLMQKTINNYEKSKKLGGD